MHMPLRAVRAEHLHLEGAVRLLDLRQLVAGEHVIDVRDHLAGGESGLMRVERTVEDQTRVYASTGR